MHVFVLPLPSIAPDEESAVKSFCVSHLTDQTLARDLKEVLARERKIVGPIIAEVLAHIAEFDARGLYRQAGHPTMKSYCIAELEMSEDEAGKRIHAARGAREYPAIFSALADGRLHLTAVNLLAPHLTPENSGTLIAAAMGKRKSEIEQLIAERFPRTETLPLVESLSAEVSSPVSIESSSRQHAPEHVPESRAARPLPIAPQRYSVPITMSQEMYDDLLHAQELLGHQVPPGDVAQVLHRGLKALIRAIEKRKYAATERPCAPRAARPNGRSIPAHVRRAVYERDGGACTFVGDHGHRCGSRRHLEFDHVVPFARGGESTVDNLRLRCRAHNQLEAELAYGPGFMDRKREEAQAAATAKEQIEDVVSGLRNLGIPAARARRAAESSALDSDATIEQRMRAALRWLVPKATSPAPRATPSSAPAST